MPLSPLVSFLSRFVTYLLTLRVVLLVPEIENSSLYQATILTMVLHNIPRDLNLAVSNGLRNLQLANTTGPEISDSSMKLAP